MINWNWQLNTILAFIFCGALTLIWNIAKPKREMPDTQEDHSETCAKMTGGFDAVLAKIDDSIDAKRALWDVFEITDFKLKTIEEQCHKISASFRSSFEGEWFLINVTVDLGGKSALAIIPEAEKDSTNWHWFLFDSYPIEECQPEELDEFMWWSPEGFFKKALGSSNDAVEELTITGRFRVDSTDTGIVRVTSENREYLRLEGDALSVGEYYEICYRKDTLEILDAEMEEWCYRGIICDAKKVNCIGGGEVFVYWIALDSGEKKSFFVHKDAHQYAKNLLTFQRVGIDTDDEGFFTLGRTLLGR